MSHHEQGHLNRPVGARVKFEALRDFIEAEFTQGVCAADALVAVRKRAAELGIASGLTHVGETKPRLRIVARP